MSTATASPQSKRASRHPVDEILPPPKLAICGFQHVLAFYAGAVIVPILLASSIKLTPEQLAYLINADLFTCGIASIIQSVGFWRIGVRLPLLQGVTFAAVSPMIAIGLVGTVAVVGIQTLRRVDFHDERNVIILAVSLGFAIAPTVYPQITSFF